MTDDKAKSLDRIGSAKLLGDQSLKYLRVRKLESETLEIQNLGSDFYVRETSKGLFVLFGFESRPFIPISTLYLPLSHIPNTPTPLANTPSNIQNTPFPNTPSQGSVWF